jgi:Icc-related predicted phosphoesterase
MRIQIASDLHLESLRRRFPDYRALDVTDADVLVLAGDIATGSDAVDVFADWPVPVIYVHGNHEAYGSVYGELTRDIQARAAGTQVRFLERDEVIIGDVRFLGCCLWTDYDLYGTPERSMQMARRFMHDHTVIRAEEGKWFMPEHALAEHEKSLIWLQERLMTPFDGRTMVVTHHGVTPASVHARYRDDPVNAGFVSDLRHILDLADFWIHGHVHDSFDYRVGAARVIANPRGYAKNLNMAGASADLKWENRAFDPALVIEV